MRIGLTGARAPATFELAHLLRAAGHEVDLVDSVPWTVSRWSRVLGPVWRVPSPRFSPRACVVAMRRLAEHRRWDAILPTCEEIFHFARAVERDSAALGAPLWAPATERLLQLHHKGEFVRLARDVGLPVPDTQVLVHAVDRRSPEDTAVDGAWVLKPVWSRFGVRVTMLQSGDAWPAAVVPTPACPWVMQRRLSGTAWCTWSVAAYFDAPGVMTTPILGYDLALPRPLGLYRLLSMIILERAQQRGLLLHASAGADEFKLLRGAVPALEYLAVDVRGRPRYATAVWRAFAAAAIWMAPQIFPNANPENQDRTAHRTIP